MFVLKTKTEKRKKGRHRKENEIQIWTAVTLSTFRVLLSYDIAYRSVTSLQI